LTNEREVESFLRMAERAAAMADATADPWLKAQWAEIANAYTDTAQSRMQAAGSRRAPDPVEGGKGDG
jgi:hypothetical protein